MAETADNLPATQQHNSRPKYVPIETLISLAQREPRLTHAEIGKIIGTSSVNVCQRLKKAGISTLPDYKKHRADIFAVKQAEILKHITDADIKKASLQQKVTAAGILYDKERLERGESTQNIATITTDIKEIRDHLQAKSGAVEQDGE